MGLGEGNGVRLRATVDSKTEAQHVLPMFGWELLNTPKLIAVSTYPSGGNAQFGSKPSKVSPPAGV